MKARPSAAAASATSKNGASGKAESLENSRNVNGKSEELWKL